MDDSVDADGFSVIIVGAGPSGLLLALSLARQGILVKVLERNSTYDNKPRACFYGYPAQFEFQRAGIMDDVKAQAFFADGISWRHMDGSLIARILTEGTPDGFEQVVLPLDVLLPIIGRHLVKQPSAKDEKRAWLDVETPSGSRRLSASYVVGCDGGSSKIRRELFGSDFPGFTWDEQIVATNVYLPKLLEHTPADWTAANFMVSREHFPVIAQISNDGLHHVTYGEKGGLTYEEMLARQTEKFKAIIPVTPEPGEYKLLNFSPYKVHQRLAPSMRVGRFLLATDAAHLCNPFGGLGLTGGLADVGGLSDCLYGLYSGKADESILDRYSEVRRQIWLEVIDPVSSANLRLLWDLEGIEESEFIKMVRKGKEDSEVEEKMRESMKAVMYDFRRHYRTALLGTG